jgi:tRNA pseudouridine55 synthase
MKTLSGLLTIDKPEGMTSRQTVTRVGNILRQAGYSRQIRVGHCGTLDPLATGVVVICIGRSTRLVQIVQELPKTYTGTFLLGCVTSTDDCTGEILRETDVDQNLVTRESVSALLPEFTGNINQVPPKFSAVHVNGKRAYKLARQGREVELLPRPVQIHRLELTAFKMPEFELQIDCGSGTYVRSLGRDIGERVGCGATMKSLSRSAIGVFSLEKATPPNQLSPENIESLVLPPITALAHLPTFQISDKQKERVYDGREIEVDSISGLAADSTADSESSARLILVDANHQLVAVSTYNSNNETAKPDMVFHDPPRDWR